MSYELGDVVTLELKIEDPTTGLAPLPDREPTNVTLTITQPDGNTENVAPITHVPGDGKWLANYLPSLHQLHAVHWSATGGETGGTLDETFFVADNGPLSIVSADEVIDHMRAQDTMTSADREQLRTYCVAATSAIEEDLGRALVRKAVTETHDGGRSVLFLRQTPVMSVSAVVESGTTLASSGDYVIDGRLGILYRGSPQAVGGFACGVQNIVVTYFAGVADLPEWVRKVAKNTVVKMWQASQQLPHPYLDGQLDGDAALLVQQATAQLTGPEYAAYEKFKMRTMA